MEFLRKRLESPDGNCVFRSGDGQFAKITVGDALKVLHNESLSSGIIDLWGELLIQHSNKERKMTSTFIFTSRIWEVVGKNGGSSSIQKIVDSQIRKAVESDILILPVFTRGAASALEYMGNYWTLLKYDVRSSTWTFFNSMQPQSADMAKFKPCFPVPVMSYMEGRMIPALRDLGKNTPLTRQEKKSSIIPLLQIKPPQEIVLVIYRV